MENENSLLLNYKCQLHSKFRIKSKEMLAWILPLEVVDRAQCLKIFTATHKLREIKFSNFTWWLKNMLFWPLVLTNFTLIPGGRKILNFNTVKRFLTLVGVNSLNQIGRNFKKESLCFELLACCFVYHLKNWELSWFS